MPATRTREEKLFGAACLRLTLESRNPSAASSEIYRGALSDLGLTEDDVEEYLRAHRGEVEARLAASSSTTRKRSS